MPDELFPFLVQAGGLFLRFAIEHAWLAVSLGGIVAFVATAAVTTILGNHAWEWWKQALRQMTGQPEQVTVDKAEFERLQRNAVLMASLASALATQNALLTTMLSAAQEVAEIEAQPDLFQAPVAPPPQSVPGPSAVQPALPE